LAPFAPHLSEELWSKMDEARSIHLSSWPQADATWLQDNEVTIGVQINGKIRGDITIATDASETIALQTANENNQIKQWLDSGELIKVVYKAGRILNLIIK